ncbi:15916_t:CDS:2 [Entrophospora sp. SA101]|nr:15916_t:CDS:2 [Entrophospora sp. SA101]
MSLLQPLTHGYRRIPVLQIGSDIFVDTLLIIEELERRYPEPSLFPKRIGSDKTNFIISLIPEDPNAPAIFKSQELLNDRSLLMNQKIEPNKLKPLRPFIIDALKSNYEWIELQLSDDRQWFLDTSTPSIGDIHVAMNIWFLNVNKGATKEFGDITELYPKTHQWFDRFIKFIRENQQHKSLRISGEEALEIAKNFKPSSYYNKNSNKKLGNKKIGDKVSISPDDYGKVPVKGTILNIGDRNIAIRPIDVDKTGIDVVIWFPIAGYNPTLQKIKVGPKSCSFIIPADNNNNGRKNITLPKFLNRDRLAKSKKSSIDNTKNDTVATATCITDTEDTGSSWLKHSSINSIISRWSEDLDQCNQTFQRQLEESHQLDQKMIEFNTGAANINVLVEKAKTIKYDICATLKEISSKQMAIDEFLSSMEKVFEGICLEDNLKYSPKTSTFNRNFFGTPKCSGVKLPNKPLNPNINIPVDSYLLAKKIKNMNDKGRLDEAITLVTLAKKAAQSEVMKRRGLHPNDMTFTILLNGLAENGTFKDNPVQLNVIHVNCFLKVCALSNNYEAIKIHFDEIMKIQSVHPNHETFTIILNSCAKQGKNGYETALRVWNHICNQIEKQHQPQHREYDVSWGPTSKQQLDKKGLILDDELVRSMMLVCKNSDQYQKGFDILGDVYGLGVSFIEKSSRNNASNASSLSRYRLEMSRKAFDVMLGLCLKSEEYKKGIQLFDEAMFMFPKLQPDIYNFHKLIYFYNETKKYEEAINVYNTIRKRNLRPIIETFDLLLNACNRANDWHSGKKLFNEMIELGRMNNHSRLKIDPHVLSLMLELTIKRYKRSGGDDLRDLIWLLTIFDNINVRNLVNSQDKLIEMNNKRFLRTITEAYHIALNDKSGGVPPGKKEIWTLYFKSYNNKVNGLENTH